MGWIWWILGFVGVLFGPVAVLSLLSRNKKVPHRRDPSSEGIAFQEIRFPTRNGKQLYGWWIPGEMDGNRPTLILVHGWSRNVERVLPYIKELHTRGYHLLAFDARHHGRSDKDRFASMPKFAEDILAAYKYLETRKEVDLTRVGVIGLSIGGAASIYAAAQNPGLKAVVTVGAFSHPAAVMRHSFRTYHVPYFPWVWLLFRYFEFRLGTRLEEIAPARHIGNIKGAVLLIHGDQDRVVPLEEAKILYRSANPDRTELWILPGKGHSDCHTDPEFWQRVDTFLRKHLPG